MSNYTKSTNFATKDNLTPGDPLKIVRGTEIDTEYNNIATAIATKTDNASAAITGGSITGITDLAIADGGTGASTATAALNNLLPSQTGNSSKYLQTDGTNATWDAVSLSTADITGTLPVANGGTGVTSSTGTGSVVLSNSPTLVTPALGTPSALVGTNITGTASGLTAGNVTTNANLTGAITSVGNATSLGSFSSANLLGALTDETGTGSAVFATSPTLVTPILGTPTSATLTNATGLPIATGVSGLGTGVATFLATPSSANLAAALTDETGSGANVFATSPTLVTPVLGTPTSATLTNATGLPLTTGVTGTLPTANGGTNLGGATPFTSGGVVYASSSSALATGSALVFDGANLGVGVTPSEKLEIYGTTPIFQINDRGLYQAQFGLIGNDLEIRGSSGVIEFYNGAADGASSTLKATLDASGNLGIGTSSPATKLEVLGAVYANNSTNSAYLFQGSGYYGSIANTSGTNTYSIGYSTNGSTHTSVLSWNASGNVGIGTNTPASGAGADRFLVLQGIASAQVPSLVLAPHVGNTHELISYNGTFSIYNSTTLQASLNNSGGFKVLNTIGVGNATPSSSGAGITFPATQSASSNANTLDDYEEGTWTPNQGSGLTVVGTFESEGYYTKIGNLVTISGYVGGSTSVTCSASGILCSNAIFTSASAGVLWTGSVLNWSADSGASCAVQQGSQNIYNGTAVTTSLRISFCVTYRGV